VPQSSTAAGFTDAACGVGEALALGDGKPSCSTVAPGIAWQRQTGRDSAAAAEGTIDWHAGWESGGSDWNGPLGDVRCTHIAAFSFSLATMCTVAAGPNIANDYVSCGKNLRCLDILKKNAGCGGISIDV
jgi:hypothetical protein